MENFLRPWSAQLLSVLRIVTGLLLLHFGTSKYLIFPQSQLSGASPSTLSGAAGIFELIGGALLVLGLFTRPVAFIGAGVYAVAYFYVHISKSFFPLLNGGSLAIMFCFALLYIAAAGGGAWSVDKMWRGVKD
ncbi:MAG TPA: DoxX family protein [Xanthobacteraceae bacterium]|nr:DoxX family protein [Xanthobacteraceae bacterium]